MRILFRTRKVIDAGIIITVAKCTIFAFWKHWLYFLPLTHHVRVPDLALGMLQQIRGAGNVKFRKQ